MFNRPYTDYKNSINGLHFCSALLHSEESDDGARKGITRIASCPRIACWRLIQTLFVEYPYYDDFEHHLEGALKQRPRVKAFGYQWQYERLIPMLLILLTPFQSLDALAGIFILSLV